MSDASLFFEEDFSNGLDNWVLDKWEDGDEIQMRIEDQALCFKTSSAQDGALLWLKKELPRKFIFECDFTPLSTEGFFLIFFCYKGQDGSSVLDPKNLVKRDYKHLFFKYTKSEFDGYHISYRRGDAANCNLRKNSGMALLNQKVLDKVLPAHQAYHLKLTKAGGHIKLEVDDTVFMDHVDDGSELGPVREGGILGLRQVYESEGAYRNIRIQEI